MKCSALIIGCGNIGALYDLNDPARVWTHAKAFSKNKEIVFSVADSNIKLARKIARHYNVEYIELCAGTDFSQFDIVSITTPTPTHFTYLKALLSQKIPIIICEKPVAADKKQLGKLAGLYKKSGSKVLVNYIRRFQPAYDLLKYRLKKQLALSACTAINIKYQRGLLNNGGHAFDLLEFLFGKPFLFNSLKVQHASFDAFPYDPTISGSCLFDGCPVTILGIEKALYPLFEIEIFFPAMKIHICHSGDEVRYYKYDKKIRRLEENKGLRQLNILSHYMLPVINKAVGFLKNMDQPDNFLQAVDLNKKIAHVISTIRKKDN